MSPERELFPQLLGELDELADTAVTRPLEEITSGSSSFSLREEWVEWYHYLLPRLVTRQWAPTYFQPAETLFSAFMNQHSGAGSPLPYPEFRDDALNTLGRYIMSPVFWPDGRLDVVNCLSKWTGPSGVAGWYRAGNLLSASLFFCAKYLMSDNVEYWLRSVVRIPDRGWQLQIITWLTGAYPLLAGEIAQPADFVKARLFDVGWNWSHAVRSGDTGQPFLPAASREAIVEVARGAEMAALLEDIWTDPTMTGITAEAAGLPEQFLTLYRA